MLQKRSSFRSKIGIVLACILMLSLFPKSVTGFYDVDVPHQNPEQKIEQSTLISFQPTVYENPIKRYIVFGPGPVSDITSRADNVSQGVNSTHGSFVVGAFRHNDVATIQC